MSGYNFGKYVEQQKAEEARKQRERELEIRELRLEMREKLLEQDKKIEVQGQLFKQEQFEMKQEIQELRMDHKTLKLYVEQEFKNVYVKMEQELSKVHTRIDELRNDVKKEMQEMKHHFGQEILRIDRQQMTIVTALERYAQQVEHYRKESEYLKREAMQIQRDSAFILRRAEHQYQKVQWKEKKLKDTLESYQGKMFVEFQKQKMLLDDISIRQHYAMKDIAYGKEGVQAMQKELNLRARIERQGIESSKQEVLMLQRSLEKEKVLARHQFSSQSKIGHLERKLRTADENMEIMRRRYLGIYPRSGMKSRPFKAGFDPKWEKKRKWRR